MKNIYLDDSIPEVLSHPLSYTGSSYLTNVSSPRGHRSSCIYVKKSRYIGSVLNILVDTLKTSTTCKLYIGNGRVG
jgi:hypothetical protein